MQKKDYAALAKQYGDDVLSGKIPACKWVKRACERQKKDLAKQVQPYYQWRYEADRGIRVCSFIELCPHIKGKLRGQRIRLEPWQVFILMTVFSWVNKTTGLRRFRRVYIEIPRGNGKSALSSALGLYMAFMDGEGGAEVYSAATTRDQAKIVFDAAQAMARSMPQFLNKFGVEVNAHAIVQINTASTFKPLSSEANTLDGLNIHFAIVDELHAHPTREVYDVLETGTGKREQSLLWVITTAGSNREGICYEVRSYLIKLLDGVFEDDSVFGIVYGLDDDDDWAEEESWIKANPNWGVSVVADAIRQVAKKAIETASAQPAFQQKHLNIWTSADHTWMNMQKWDACSDPNLNEANFEEVPAIIGLDVASKLDLLALVRLHVKHVDGKQHFYAFGRYWLPEAAIHKTQNSQYQGWVINEHLQTCPGETNDFDVVEDEIRNQYRRFEVQEVAHDQYNATSFVNHLQPEGVVMVEVPQRTQFFSPAMKELEAAVYDGRFHHNGDPILTWAVSNVVCHRDKNDNLFPNKERFENKIDPVVALLLAMSRAITIDLKPAWTPPLVQLW